jgi:hypothetical protein
MLEQLRASSHALPIIASIASDMPEVRRPSGWIVSTPMPVAA